MRLKVYIEIDGYDELAGEITGNSSVDAVFAYADSYMGKPGACPISISLPFMEGSFDAVRTRNFFDGLLPEGFTRKCVAERIKSDENDYISILAKLGKECLGAIRIVSEDAQNVSSSYQVIPEKDIRNLAKEGAAESAQFVTKSHLSLTGASGKVGLYYDERGGKWYLPIGNAPSTHIVKQSHVRLGQIVTNEQLCLLTARNLGIEVPESFIINTGDGEDENVLFATRRYDRVMLPDGRTVDGLSTPSRLHQEDFAQALGIPAFEKYEKDNMHYLKKMFDILKNYSADPIADQLKLWDICVFNYLIGNTDNHIKNVSLLYSENLKSIRLAPAYDIVSTLVYESSSEDMSISIDGKYNIYEITRTSFAKEATYIGIGPKLAMARFDSMEKRFYKALECASNDLKKQGFENAKEVYEKIVSGNKKRKLTSGAISPS